MKINNREDDTRRTWFSRYWWVFAGVLSAVALSTALNITNTDSWIVVTNPSNDTWVINWNTTRPATCTPGNYSRWNGSGFVCAPDQSGNASVNLSAYVPYVGATQDLDLAGRHLRVHAINSTDSAGLAITSFSLLPVALMGVGSTNNSLFYGSVTFSQNICLGGVCRGTWPVDTYTNVTALQNSNITTNARIDNLNSTKLNVSDQRYNDTAAINAVSTFSQTKAATGSVSSTTQCLQNLTLTNTTLTGEYTACGGGGGGGVTTVNTGNGLTGGPITTTGNISINAPTCSATEYSYWTGTAWACRTDQTGGGGSVLPFNSVGFYENDYEFESVTAGRTEIWIPTAISAGTTALISGEYDRPGLVTVSSSTTASSGYSYQLDNAAVYLLGTGYGAQHIVAPIPKTGNGTTCRLGFQDVFTVAATVDAVFWNATQNNATTFNWTPVVRSNSVEVRGSIVTYAANANQYYRAVVDVINTTQAVFTLINSTNAAVLNRQVINATIPSVAGRETSHAVNCYVNGGTTAQVLARFDYIGVYNNATTFTR